MSNIKKKNKTERRESDRVLAQGIQKQPLTVVTVVNKTQYTDQQVVDVLTKRTSLGDATDAAHGAWIGAAKAETGYVKQTQPVVNAVKRRLRDEYGQDATALAVYGLTPAEARVPTTAVKAEAVKKRASTKAAGGKKAEQKAATAQAEAAVPAVHATPVEPAPAANKQQ
jgi:hypothetical protein